jgi:lipid-A-disaccharide synthase
VLYYILPQVWAWRRGRIRKLARRAERLAVILPFEVDVYRRDGVDVEFVGHPLVDATRSHCARADRSALRREFRLAEAPAVALLPGSRSNELAYQLPLQLAAARELHARRPETRFVVALAPSLSLAAVEARIAAAGLAEGFPLRVVKGRTYDVLSACDVALVKPGTATLESALLGCPLVVAGRGHPLSAAILRRLVDVPAWAMPNLIAGELVVPELLQEQATPEALASALGSLLEPDGRERQLAGLRRVRERLGEGGATERVASIAEEMLGTVRA